MCVSHPPATPKSRAQLPPKLLKPTLQSTDVALANLPNLFPGFLECITGCTTGHRLACTKEVRVASWMGTPSARELDSPRDW